MKPHGALYHRASVDEACAAAIVSGVLGAGGPRAMLAFPGSRLYAVAKEAGLVAVAEGFADRAYDANGQLVVAERAGCAARRRRGGATGGGAGGRRRLDLRSR